MILSHFYLHNLIQVKPIQSEQFTSLVYVLTSSSSEEVFLIDCGGFQSVLEVLDAKQKVCGIFLTHYHYDHIYYLSKWIDQFPNLVVYGSEKTALGIQDAKVNLSFYHEDPVHLEVPNYRVLSDSEEEIIWDIISIKAFETEGHCDGSITFQMGNCLFTGDTLIPNIPTVTKLKTGSKEKLQLSIKKIKCLITDETLICPGHLKMISAKEVEWEMY